MTSGSSSLAQRIVAQHAAMQAHLQLDAGHAEIVAGDVLDLGRPLVDADRAGEVDGRRQVGDDVELPARLLVAARLQGDLLALGDGLFDLVLALADGRENSVSLPSIESCGGLRPRVSSTKPAILLPTGTRSTLSCSAMSR